MGMKWEAECLIPTFIAFETETEKTKEMKTKVREVTKVPQ